MRILYVDIDTLNANHMGCYGYCRNTTPNIDEIAKEGVTFSDYYCSDAPCLPSRASMVSGMFGIHNGCVGHGGTAAEKRFVPERRGFRNADDQNNLFSVFRKKNMKTASISTFAERHSAWWFNSGFHEMYNQGQGGLESGEKVLPTALKWLEENSDKDNWFLHFHIWDPHTPIRVPETYPVTFENEPLPRWYTQELLDKSINVVGPHSINEIGMYTDNTDDAFPRQLGKATNMTELKEVIDGYDLGVNYADFIVGQIFEKLRNQGIYEDTAIIISSDHGENLGELGIYQEHGTADYPTCHIPMIIKWPGALKNHVARELYYNLDLAPTLADLLGVEKYKYWDGTSFADVIMTAKENKRDYIVISQMAHVCQRSVRFKDYLYIKTYHCGFRLFDEEMLFNIAADPHEEHDLKTECPEIVEQARAYLGQWIDDMMSTSGFDTDPMQTVLREGGPFHAPINVLPKYIERLKKTGRETGAEKLSKKYAEKLRDAGTGTSSR